MAFVRTVPDGDERYESTAHVVPADGGEPRRVTATERTDGSPRRSPEEDYPAFTGDRGEPETPQLRLLPQRAARPSG